MKRTTRNVVKTTTVSFTGGPVRRSLDAEEPILSVDADWIVELSENEGFEAPLQTRAQKTDNFKTDNFVELYPRNLCPVCPAGAVIRKGDGKTFGIYCCPGLSRLEVRRVARRRFLTLDRILRPQVRDEDCYPPCDFH